MTAPPESSAGEPAPCCKRVSTACSIPATHTYLPVTHPSLPADIIGSITLLVVKGDERVGQYRQQMQHLQAYAAMNDLPQVRLAWVSLVWWVFCCHACVVGGAKAQPSAWSVRDAPALSRPPCRTCARACSPTSSCTSTIRHGFCVWLHAVPSSTSATPCKTVCSAGLSLRPCCFWHMLLQLYACLLPHQNKCRTHI